MLRKNVMQFVKYQKTLRENASYEAPKHRLKPKERATYARIRKTTKKALDDMIFLMENLPEKQLEQIFNRETLKLFFEGLLRQSEARRKRILRLWYLLLFEIPNPTYAINLIGREKWQMFSGQKSTALQAVYSAAMFEE
jgi:hypothetical protein